MESAQTSTERNLFPDQGAATLPCKISSPPGPTFFYFTLLLDHQDHSQQEIYAPLLTNLQTLHKIHSSI